MLALSWPYVASRVPMLPLSDPYVGPFLVLCRPIVSTNFPELGQNSFALSSPSLTLCGPYLAPMLALSGPYGPYLGPYVGPILALSYPVSLTLA